MAFFGVRRALLYTTAYHPNNSFYGVTDPTLASINATAWDATVSNAPVALNPLTNLVLSRQGFSTTGATALYNETLTLTQRVRLPWPYQASLDPLRVALSDYVYSTDSCFDRPGVVNNSALASPPPVCNWVLPDRQVVGNSLTAELVAFHRNARNGSQVACVVFTATDTSSNSVSVTVATPTVSTTVGGVYNASTNLSGLDQNAVISYSAVLNLSGLVDGEVITLNAQVYPWIGAGAGSIATTVGATAGTRTFCPQIYYKHLAAANTPTLAYVNSGGAGSDGNGSWLAGSDTTGVLSTTAATARATPFATIGGALTKMKTAAGSAGIDGGRVRLMAGTQTVGTVSYNTNYTINAEVIIEADPFATQATAILNFTASGPQYITLLRIQNCTINRSATAAFQPTTFTLQNVIFNDAGSTGLKSVASVTRMVGVSFFGGFNVNETTTILLTLLRGINVLSNTTTDHTIDPWCVVGSAFSRVQFSTNGLSESGVTFAFNRVMNKLTSATSSITLASAVALVGAAIVQNVFERAVGVDGGTGDVAISADSATGNTTHFICHNNTVVSAGNAGHCNMLYNENPTTARSHSLQSYKGNIWCTSATKHDTFLASNYGYVSTNPGNIATCAGREGGWGYMYGCGVQGELEIWMNSFGNMEGSSGNAVKDFAGLNCVFPNVFTAHMTMNFTNYQAVTVANYGTTPATSWVYTAGAGFGDYHINAGSAAIGVLPIPVLAFDLSGTARHSASTAAGAYEF